MANSPLFARQIATDPAHGLTIVPYTRTESNKRALRGAFRSPWQAFKAGDMRAASRLLHGRWVQIVYLLVDILLIAANGLAVFFVRFGAYSWRHFELRPFTLRVPTTSVVKDYLAFLVLFAALVVLFCESYGLYRTEKMRSSIAEAFGVFRAVLIASLFLTGSIYVWRADISRSVIALSAFLTFVALAGWRAWKRQVIMSRIENGVNVRNVLILGNRRQAENLAETLTRHKEWGYAIKGMLLPTAVNKQQDIINALLQSARANFVDEIFFVGPATEDLLHELALVTRQNGLDLKLVPDTYGGALSGAPVLQLGEFPVFALNEEPVRSVALFFKRLIDVVISGAILVFISPLLVMISIAIRLDSPGPVLYCARRVGKKGRTFICYKFRTMVVNADDLKQNLRSQNQRHGPFFKLKNDPRITRMGKWLRKYSLDELPQFWNVVKGDMSLVGPRPHPIDDYEHYSLEHLRRLDVTPGLTGVWQINARHDPSFDRNMQMDLEYIENWDIWFDLRIIFQTIPAVLRGSGQ